MDKFQLNNQVEKVLRGESPHFLNTIDLQFVINHIKKYKPNYKIFKLYDDAEKIILYTEFLSITLFEIKAREKLTHREILGSLFSHNIRESLYGDIIVGDTCYIVVLDIIKDYMLNHFNQIGNKKVKLIEKDIDEVKDYHNTYQEIVLHVSSLRMDNVISKLIPTSRVGAQTIIKEKKVMINYSVLTQCNYMLKENDIFSVRGVGKFKYVKIQQINKNKKYCILIKKYISS